MAAGGSPERWWPVAAFLGVALTGSLCFLITLLLTRRRAFRLRTAALPWETRLSKPAWMFLDTIGLLAASSGLVAALIAVFGFPGAGVGVLLGFTGLGSLMLFTYDSLSPRGLTFGAGGLHVHLRGVTFAVPWAAITHVERVGPDHTQLVRLHLQDVDAVMKSAVPNTPRTLERVATCIREGSRPDGRLMLMPGTAGLDGPTLARTVEAAIAGRAGRPN
jgi:hypothetical protein